MSEPDPTWVASLRSRLERAPIHGSGLPVSIKVRVKGGCFCRSCCPSAWQQIDEAFPHLRDRSDDYVFEEHETGPEVIMYLAVAHAGICLAKSIVDLITTIIKARSDGAKIGDRRPEPIELIVRYVREDSTLREEVAMEVEQHKRVTKKQVNDGLVKALEKLTEDAR